MGTFIIAEAGVNHNGSIELAKKLIDAAIDAGSNAVKFQSFKTDKLVTRLAPKAGYQITNTGSSDTQYSMLKKLELSREAHIELIEYCRLQNIQFLSTPFDEESADLLDELRIEQFKISSGEITNKYFLEHIAKKQKPIILSTGMSTLGEIEEALGWIYGTGNKHVTLLHCTSNYPAEIAEVNLKAMLTLKEAFGVKTGYSDHTLGITVPIAAAALGADIIEKHFTLDKNMDGPDHKASLEPAELKEMVQAIRNVETALGDGIKRITKSEMSVRDIARKSIVTCKSIKKGQTLTGEMLTTKRPGEGLRPKYIDDVIGKTAAKDMPEDYVFKIGDFY